MRRSIVRTVPITVVVKQRRAAGEHARDGQTKRRTGTPTLRPQRIQTQVWGITIIVEIQLGKQQRLGVTLKFI